MRRVDLLYVLASLEPATSTGCHLVFTLRQPGSAPALHNPDCRISEDINEWMGISKGYREGQRGSILKSCASIFPRKHFLLLPGFPSCELRWKQDATAASRPQKPQMKTEKKRPQARLLLIEISTDVIISSFLSEVDNVLILTKEQ